jgi:hypothetical protein
MSTSASIDNGAMKREFEFYLAGVWDEYFRVFSRDGEWVVREGGEEVGVDRGECVLVTFNHQDPIDGPDDDAVELVADSAWLDVSEDDGLLTLPDGSFYEAHPDLVITLCRRSGNFLRFRRAGNRDSAP